ncbi:macrolide ABC transporter permease/ATP-binding protein MacB [Aliidiomarina minuta]|uniref:Macrolide ABC transporter permease/ATP-binding protein MacB n=1 Tax=Aliidiomarina minuta TaxID=880057 RepID=A0A432W967_9GAMM|nr:MacB family efflux pump subunit [Aliidiomarina minuta]RUO26697.1 macrolide ABC transporter permease/ATP-binding protein MacB [Aliidiomarina minuta]
MMTTETNSRPLISLRGLTKSYQTGELVTQVLHGVDLDIEAGEFVAIMGSSGSGKSTLMNILGCLDKPTTGDYWFRGHSVAKLNHDQLAALRRDAFGFVFQNYNLLAAADAVGNVELPAVYSGTPAHERHQRACELLQQLGLGDRLDHRPGQLSGGQQQRVSVARALMNGGDIILADEPTGALDSQSGKDVMEILAQLSAAGHTVILITHDPEVAEHADRLIEIKDGHVVSDTRKAVQTSKAAPKKTPPRGKASLLNDLGEAFTTAGRSLRSNIFRTMLTLLGIVIGVASVISMLAIGQGAQQEVVDRIGAMGSNLLTVFPGAPNQRGRWNVATLVPEDVDAIQEIPNVLTAVPELTGNQTLRRAGFDQEAQINATYSSFPLARQWQVSEGSFFTEEDEALFTTVAVIGKTVAQQMFPQTDPLGEFLLINNVLFRVIGVMEERGASPWGQDQDDVVFVPFSTGSLRLFGQRFVRNVTVAIDNTDFMHETHQQVHQLLLERHGVEDFTIRNMASIIEAQTETENTMTLLLGVIAVISLVVGGIGVMNIMLVSVTERTREIGVRMATGARRLHIMQQFLIEALTVSLLGGLLGVIIGVGATAIIASLGTSVHYALLPVVLAFSCAFLTGLIFGYLPARKASRLDPVQALSSE